MSDRRTEEAEQARWRLRAPYAGVDWFVRLVAAEFAPPAERAAAERGSLARILAFAAGAVPYYADVFGRAGLHPDDIDGRAALPRLPVLDRATVLAQADLLEPRQLPASEQVAGATATSGSTGQPVTVEVVADIPRASGGKYQDFVSECFPTAGRHAHD